MQRRKAGASKTDASIASSAETSSDDGYTVARPPRRVSNTVASRQRVSCGLVAYIIFSVVCTLLALSWIWSQTLTFGYTLPNWRKYIPRAERLFTPEELAKYDGTDADLPVYLAVLGRVYDVTEGREFYGKGKGYGSLAGRDGSRSFTTGCFGEYVTHDVRGLTESEMKSVEKWVRFYDDHSQYFYVGRVEHAPIPEDAPLPADCRPPKPEKPAAYRDK